MIKRTMTYKKVKRLVPACPKCKEELAGNGSGLSPYRCSCGYWKPLWDRAGEYKIVKEL